MLALFVEVKIANLHYFSSGFKYLWDDLFIDVHLTRQFKMEFWTIVKYLFYARGNNKAQRIQVIEK